MKINENAKYNIKCIYICENIQHVNPVGYKTRLILTIFHLRYIIRKCCHVKNKCRSQKDAFKILSSISNYINVVFYICICVEYNIYVELW